MKTLRQIPAKELYNYIKLNWVEQSIYFWVDVWKEILDIWVTIGNSNVQVYLWSINNTASGFKQVEDVIMNLILLWINENNIYFWTENTWIYWHDIMNYFSDRIPNTYILNSSLTCHARQYYATSNFKNDEVDSVMIATTLQDLNNKWRLESVNNPYKRWCGMWFIRRSFSNERSSLRLLSRRLAKLRETKSNLMRSINMSKERLFPEIYWLFSIKHRASVEWLLIESFTREEILSMDRDEFIEKYKSIASKWQQNSKVMEKVLAFYDKITERWAKISRSELDNTMWVDSDHFILEDIKFKLKYYDLVTKEIEYIQSRIEELLNILKNNWYYIPKFSGINDVEIWILLWELGNDIYNMSTREFLGFIWWYPDNFTSWWWHMVKEAKFSNKKWVIKKFVYIWMYWFQLHTPSFRLYKKLLLLMYWVWETSTTVNIKNRRKTEAKCWKKLLEIIHNWYRNKTTFNDTMFIKWTINPIIQTIKSKWLSDEIISQTIKEVYNTQPIPACIII